ncbi:MAG: NADH-quinone oxidoreductase subunit N, partial [Chloroflexota bacterium]
KGILTAVSVVGLLVPLAFALSLSGGLGGVANGRAFTFSDMFIVDSYSIFFKVLFIVVAALVILASQDYMYKMKRFQGEYLALVLFCTAGFMFLASAGELITIYLSLELTALSLCVLICFLKDGRSTEASIKFLLLSAISSAVMLYGMALIFGLTGTTNLAEIARSIGSVSHMVQQPALLMGVVFIITGFGFKVASVPFQMWVPDAYEGAPTPVTAFLSVASKAAGFAVLLRVLYMAFGSVSVDWGQLFAVLAAASMFLGNLVAIVQTNVKRMLAYSTIAHAGYMLIGLAATSALGTSAVLFYMAAYAVTNLGAFFAIIAITNKTGSDNIADFTGMAQRAPVLSFVLAVCLVSLTGVPPTAVFWAKIYLFNAAIQSNLVWLVVVGVANSVISAYFYMRVIKVMYLGQPASDERVPSSGALRLALAITGIGVIVIGLLPAPLLRAAEVALTRFP